MRENEIEALVKGAGQNVTKPELGNRLGQGRVYPSATRALQIGNASFKG